MLSNNMFGNNDSQNLKASAAFNNEFDSEKRYSINLIDY